MKPTRKGTRRRQVTPPRFSHPSNVALRTQGPRRGRPSLRAFTPGISSLGLYPIYSSPTVYGMLVGTWSPTTPPTSPSYTPEIVAKLYRYPNLSSAVNTLSDSLKRSWQEELSETGSGSITLMADDGDLSSFQDDGDDIIVFTYRDQRAFAMLAEKKQEMVVAEDEEGGEAVTYSGRGLMALFERILVYPTGGVGRKPVEEDRTFNWTSPSYDDSSWSLAGDLGGLRDMCNVAGFLLGIDGNTISTGLPNDYYTSVLWAPGYTFVSTVPVGKCYFRQTITVPSDGPYRIFLGCDDEGTLFVDGQEVVKVDGINWFGVQSVDIDLTAGQHLIAGVVENKLSLTSIITGDPGINPGKFVFQVYQIDLLRQALPEYLIAASNLWECKCSPYPANPPGMTVGRVLRLCIEEAQARGYLTSLTLNFSDTVDSAGKPWPLQADIATKVGTDVLTFMRELSSTYCDLWMSPTTLKLWAWVIDGRGSTKSSVSVNSPTSEADPFSGNLLNYEREGEFFPIGAFLLRWKDGWAERTDAASVSSYGRREALLEIGAPTSIEEVNRVSDKQFRFFSDPRTSITTKVAPVVGGDEPYVDFTVGDQIDTPDGIERVLAITMEEDDLGEVFATLTLRNIIVGAMERAWNALRKVG